MSDMEFNWLIAHPEEAEKYPGEYIAIVGESIVDVFMLLDSGADPSMLIAAVFAAF